MCSNQFLLSVLFQALLLFLRRGVNFCSRAWRERNGRSSVLGRDLKPLVCCIDLYTWIYLFEEVILHWLKVQCLLITLSHQIGMFAVLKDLRDNFSVIMDQEKLIPSLKCFSKVT